VDQQRRQARLHFRDAKRAVLPDANRQHQLREDTVTRFACFVCRRRREVCYLFTARVDHEHKCITYQTRCAECVTDDAEPLEPSGD
jgi:hypothetical protein